MHARTRMHTSAQATNPASFKLASCGARPQPTGLPALSISMPLHLHQSVMSYTKLPRHLRARGGSARARV